jgi:hypothetical protein
MKTGTLLNRKFQAFEVVFTIVFFCSVLLCIQTKILNQITLALRQIIFLMCINPEIEDEYESGSGNVIYGFV